MLCFVIVIGMLCYCYVIVMLCYVNDMLCYAMLCDVNAMLFCVLYVNANDNDMLCSFMSC